MAVKVGVVGLGMMGITHLDAYAQRGDVEVVALADRDPSRLAGKEKAKGNIEGQARGGLDLPSAKRYTDAAELIQDPDVEAVDICLPTPAHLPFGMMALEAGKHLLLEKPIARTSSDAMKLVQAATASGKIVMPAMCMRFWPGWTWLKKACDQQTYGKVLGATFRRVASHPKAAFYASGQASGGAALDLHIHDTDFIQFLFGQPKGVQSVGYSRPTDAVDHIVTRYEYDDIPLVVAEGSWAMADGFSFSMAFTVNFEHATAEFGAGEKPLTLYRDGKAEPVEIEPGMGYDYEIGYFIECVKSGRQPETVTMLDAANAVRIVEAEVESVNTGRPVSL
ncbi:MAG: Gfo/Idh/MocA family oxidoreductase [Planctomycetota bacterium]